MKTSTLAMAVGVLIIVALAAGVAVLYMGRNYGTLSVGVTDAPVGGVSHLYLTITDITLQGENNSSSTFKVNSTNFDLLSLQNVTKMLGTNSVPVGNYTMIRFTVTSAVATISGTNVTLTVPSGEVKIPFTSEKLQVRSGAATSIILDISADMTNISASHNFSPVVHVKSMEGPS